MKLRPICPISPIFAEKCGILCKKRSFCVHFDPILPIFAENHQKLCQFSRKSPHSPPYMGFWAKNGLKMNKKGLKMAILGIFWGNFQNIWSKMSQNSTKFDKIVKHLIKTPLKLWFYPIFVWICAILPHFMPKNTHFTSIFTTFPPYLRKLPQFASKKPPFPPYL